MLLHFENNKEKMYQCGYCDLIFDKYDNISEHEKLHERIINDDISNVSR